MRRVSGVALAVLLWAGAAWAHQPVMDMAPRWAGGYGAQVRQEYRSSDTLLRGDDEQPNPQGARRRVSTTWLEGIYTFTREVRATIKLPYVDQERSAVVNGVRQKLRGRGLGDMVLAVPLRKYWNLEGATANIGLTPQLRVPTGSTRDDDPVGDGSWDFGLSGSFSSESFRWYTLVDVFWWKNTPGRRGIDQGDLVGLDVNLGYHPWHDNEHNAGVFVMLDVEARYESRGTNAFGFATGGTRLGVGPVLVGYWRNVMARAEAKFPVYERVFDTQVSRGVQLNVGIGVTF